MTDETGSHNESLSVPELERMERVCLQFEAAWKNGSNPQIEDYLGTTQGPERGQLLRELLLLELDYRGRSDRHPTKDEYRARFPQESKLVSDVFEKLSTGAAMTETNPSPSAVGYGHRTFPRRFGDYELLELLGEGGMGIVYRARQQTPDRIVALKIIRPDRLAAVTERRERVIERFHAETQAAARLEHEHIVPVYEVGQTEGQPFFSMRYIQGRGLEEVLRDGPLAGRDTAAVLEPIARALHYAHGRDIVHRDIKPRNILLDTDGKPYIADFGLAKSFAAAHDLTQTAEAIGTPAYMSPEQTSGPAGVDCRTDVYSLGATLYELLAGRPPFRAATIAETQRQLIENEPVPPRQLNPAIERDLETICLKCLEKEPAKRYGTAEQLADELARYQQGRPIQARPITRLARGWRWCKRNRTLASVGATAAFLLLMLAIGGPVAALNRSALLEDRTTLLGEKTKLLEERTGLLSDRTKALNVATFEQGQAEAARDTADAAQKKTRRTLYVADMKRAEYYCELDNIGVVRALLNQYLPKADEEDLRSFEWYYWWQQCHQDLMTLEHASEVQHVAFSPDGELLATASMGSRVKPGLVGLWEVSTGKKVHEFQVAYREFRGLAFSAKGDTLAAAGAFWPWIKTWNVKKTVSGHLPKPQQPPKPLDSSAAFRWSVAFAPDLQGYAYTVGGLSRHVCVVDAAVEESLDVRGIKPEKCEGGFEGNNILARPGKGPIIVGSPGGAGRFYSQVDEDAPPLREYGGPIFCMAFSPDGKNIAAGGRQGTVKLWDATTGELKLAEPLKGHTGVVWAVAFSPDGKSLASAGSDGAIVLWDVATGTSTARINAHAREIRSLVFLPDGDSLASASADSTIKLWDLATGQLKSSLKGHEGPVNSLACSADGRMLATAGTDRTVKLWSTAEEQDRLGREGRRPIATVREMDRGPEKARQALPPSPVYDVAFSSNGRTLAVATRNATNTFAVPVGMDNTFGSTNRVELWDWRKRKKVGSGGAYQSTLSIKPSLALSPDGRLLYTGWFLQDLASRTTLTGDRKGWSLGGEEVRVSSFPFGAFPVEEQGEQFTRGKAPLSLTPEISGAFSPDGRILATAGSDGTVKLWEPITGKLLDKLSSEASCCQCVAFSADGKTLAAAADHEVQLWNVDSRKLQRTFQGHSDYVRSIVFSRDGKTLVSASSDGTAKLWDADARSVRATLRGHYGGVSSLAISPDDKTIASAGRDGSIKLWDLESGEEKTTLKGHAGWVTSVAFSPDGLTLVSTSEDGTVRLWHGKSDIPAVKTQTATAAR